VVVDDSSEAHDLLAPRLRSLGFGLQAVHTGGEIFQAIRRDKPDLILLESALPDISGFEVLSAINNDPETMDTAVIVLSASDHSADKVLAFELGAVDYVTRPFDPAELLARIRCALRTRQLVRMLEERAQLDALTGLWNRAYPDRALASAVRAARRHEQALSVILCDIDHFKQLNDTFGHACGDLVLERFAEVLLDTVRGSDEVCRYGGEEFAIIAPVTPADEARACAERVRAAVEETNWPGGRDEALRLTASFGVAALADLADLADLAEPSASALLEAADQALYAAKEAGRNRVVHHKNLGNVGPSEPTSPMRDSASRL